jgi:hypothetical protein
MATIDGRHVTGYAIYNTINLHIRKRTCWLYFSCLFDCLQRRRIKYTYREICSYGSKYEYYTCLGNYLPDCMASDPPKNCSLSPQILTVCVDDAYKRSSAKTQNTLL